MATKNKTATLKFYADTRAQIAAMNAETDASEIAELESKITALFRATGVYEPDGKDNTPITRKRVDVINDGIEVASMIRPLVTGVERFTLRACVTSNPALADVISQYKSLIVALKSLGETV